MASKYKYLSTKEERNEYRKTHDTYFKCMIHGAHLSDVIENWEYALTDNVRKAKTWFTKELGEQLDGGQLDYGFAHLYQFTKQGDEKFHKVAHWVNFWGHWITYEQFVIKNYGISLKELNKLREKEG